MKFLVDMPLSPGLSRLLCANGHDAVHASDLGLFDAEDVVILARARTEQRIVITADLDFPRLLALSHATSPGLILFRGAQYSDPGIWTRLQRLMAAIPADELSACVVVIDDWRARLRRLPI